MFNVYFLRSLCTGTTETRANFYDRFYGQLEPEAEEEAKEDQKAKLVETSADIGVGALPAAAASPLSFSHFRASVNRIMLAKDWPNVFAAIGVPLPSKAALATMLRDSVTNSRRKKYHTVYP
jgi:hypothetical protein